MGLLFIFSCVVMVFYVFVFWDIVRSLVFRFVGILIMGCGGSWGGGYGGVWELGLGFIVWDVF